jgi:cyclopropane-fatty-acyl-phospholipid synthase
MAFTNVDRTRDVAVALRPLLAELLGDDLPLLVVAWDGSTVGDERSKVTLVLRSPAALRRILFAPGELGLARAYVSGDIDVEGDVYELLGLRERFGEPDGPLPASRRARRVAVSLASTVRAGAWGGPPPPPPEEVRLRGRLHSKGRDAAAISHHYDVSNDFYKLFLGTTLTYSCAYFERPDLTLDEAQEAKYELICRKLGLQPGQRLLDVGCGWGGMVLHAARHHGVRAVGVTISAEQAALARERTAQAGLADRVEIRLCDYRDIADGPYDAISSIGMFEHVGLDELARYVEVLHGLLVPAGRLLNHGISRPSGQDRFDSRSFIQRYVFPDGELHEVGRVVSCLQEHGFEVRDVESLREHYARTLRHWVANLEARWDDAVRLVGEGRARVWHLYMAGSALGFETGRVGIHQVLGVRRAPDGHSGMPPTRAALAEPMPDPVLAGVAVAAV